MNLYHHLKNLWKKPTEQSKELFQSRVITWRRSPTVVRVEKPLRLDRAHALGYKAKQGYVMIRVRVRRSKRQRPLIKKGRRSKHRRRKKIVSKSYQWIAEERGNKKYPNCEVLGSYWIGEDGNYKFYEIILGDREVVTRNNEMGWLKNNRGRVYRGKTSAGRRSRGILIRKGKGAEKLRPSRGAN